MSVIFPLSIRFVTCFVTFGFGLFASLGRAVSHAEEGFRSRAQGKLRVGSLPLLRAAQSVRSVQAHQGRRPVQAEAACYRLCSGIRSNRLCSDAGWISHWSVDESRQFAGFEVIFKLIERFPILSCLPRINSKNLNLSASKLIHILDRNFAVIYVIVGYELQMSLLSTKKRSCVHLKNLKNCFSTT